MQPFGEFEDMTIEEVSDNPRAKRFTAMSPFVSWMVAMAILIEQTESVCAIKESQRYIQLVSVIYRFNFLKQ